MPQWHVRDRGDVHRSLGGLHDGVAVLRWGGLPHMDSLGPGGRNVLLRCRGRELQRQSRLLRRDAVREWNVRLRSGEHLLPERRGLLCGAELPECSLRAVAFFVDCVNRERLLVFYVGWCELDEREWFDGQCHDDDVNAIVVDILIVWIYLDLVLEWRHHLQHVRHAFVSGRNRGRHPIVKLDDLGRGSRQGGRVRQFRRSHALWHRASRRSRVRRTLAATSA